MRGDTYVLTNKHSLVEAPEYELISCKELHNCFLEWIAFGDGLDDEPKGIRSLALRRSFDEWLNGRNPKRRIA